MLIQNAIIVRSVRFTKRWKNTAIWWPVATEKLLSSE